MSRLQALEQLSNALPGIDEKVRRQQKAADDIMFRQALLQQPQQAGTTRIAQQAAPQMVQADAARNQQAAMQQQKQQSQIAQMGLQEQKMGQQAALSEQQLANQKVISDTQMEKSKKLSQAGIDHDNRLLNQSLENQQAIHDLEKKLNNQTFSMRKNFAESEMGRKFTNDRQLADWTIANAKDTQDFNNKMQLMEQSHKKKMMLLNYTQQALIQKEKQLAKQEQTEMIKASRIKIKEAATKAEQAIAQDKADANSRAAMITGAVTVIGAVGGAVLASTVTGGIGAGAGGAIGASIGSGAGKAISGIFS